MSDQDKERFGTVVEPSKKLKKVDLPFDFRVSEETRREIEELEAHSYFWRFF